MCFVRPHLQIHLMSPDIQTFTANRWYPLRWRWSMWEIFPLHSFVVLLLFGPALILLPVPVRKHMITDYCNWQWHLYVANSSSVLADSLGLSSVEVKCPIISFGWLIKLPIFITRKNLLVSSKDHLVGVLTDIMWNPNWSISFAWIFKCLIPITIGTVNPNSIKWYSLFSF